MMLLTNQEQFTPHFSCSWTSFVDFDFKGFALGGNFNYLCCMHYTVVLLECKLGVGGWGTIQPFKKLLNFVCKG